MIPRGSDEYVEHRVPLPSTPPKQTWQRSSPATTVSERSTRRSSVSCKAFTRSRNVDSASSANPSSVDLSSNRAVRGVHPRPRARAAGPPGFDVRHLLARFDAHGQFGHERGERRSLRDRLSLRFRTVTNVDADYVETAVSEGSRRPTTATAEIENSSSRFELPIQHRSFSRKQIAGVRHLLVFGRDPCVRVRPPFRRPESRSSDRWILVIGFMSSR